MFNMTDRQSAAKQVIFKQLPLDLNGFEKKYFVTNDGRIYSEYLQDYLKTFYSKGGKSKIKLR